MARKMSEASQEILAVSCPTCGSGKGINCRTGRGDKLSAANSHNGRKDKAATREKSGIPQEDIVSEGTPWRDTEEAIGVVLGYNGEALAVKEVERQKKIDNVLWGITFSRDIMKMSQYDLDRRLAEMIVDGDASIF